MSLRCPACSDPLCFEDFTLHRSLEGRVSTLGQVRVARDCAMFGQVVCGHLLSEGSFDGEAMVYGPIELLRDSTTAGRLTGRSLKIAGGATVRAAARIGPTSTNRPVRPRADLQRAAPAESAA